MIERVQSTDRHSKHHSTARSSSVVLGRESVCCSCHDTNWYSVRCYSCSRFPRHRHNLCLSTTCITVDSRSRAKQRRDPDVQSSIDCRNLDRRDGDDWNDISFAVHRSEKHCSSIEQADLIDGFGLDRAVARHCWNQWSPMVVGCRPTFVDSLDGRAKEDADRRVDSLEQCLSENIRSSFTVTVHRWLTQDLTRMELIEQAMQFSDVIIEP